MCGKERNGIEIRNDRVIDAIRWMKKTVLHKESSNRLVVCKDCYENYKKAKKRFDSRRRIYLILGIIFALLIIIGSVSVWGVILGIVVLGLIYAFSFFSYIPSLAIDVKSEKSSKT